MWLNISITSNEFWTLANVEAKPNGHCPAKNDCLPLTPSKNINNLSHFPVSPCIKRHVNQFESDSSVLNLLFCLYLDLTFKMTNCKDVNTDSANVTFSRLGSIYTVLLESSFCWQINSSFHFLLFSPPLSPSHSLFFSLPSFLSHLVSQSTMLLRSFVSISHNQFTYQRTGLLSETHSLK